ncbi:MAG: hypothetical protein LUG16_05960, partial [Candidatus Gastranaerophilales bacterium]|nr:hypothetical protein [Candidatus Gastranaerophilales bacterium]
GIYINNPAVKMKLNIPETIDSKIFTADNIPSDTEQIMFFDIPVSFELFSKIIKITNAKIIHLMNFLPSEITTDSFILKLSGMLKYALSNLNGIVNIQRASKALSVDEDTIDCALNLFWDSEMIDLERKDDENYVISYLHPVELSKIKNAGVYTDLETHINSINAFKTFYLNSPVEEIKSYAIC